MRERIGIVWFKRDLRVKDHLPIVEASLTGLPLLPLYIVENQYWAQPFASRRHWYFIHDCLTDLRRDCQRLGQTLVIRTGDVVSNLEDLSKQFSIQQIYAHEESGNGWTYERDKAVSDWCKVNCVSLLEYPCNGVVRRLRSRDDWSKIRNQRMAQDLVPEPQCLKPIPDVLPGRIPAKDDPMFGETVPGIVQPGGRIAADQTLKSFLEIRGQDYLFNLSKPGISEETGSRLSSHLTWGTLSVREVVRAQKDRRSNLDKEEAKSWKRNLSAFGSRMSWRCHFIQKIEDQPEIEFKCMHPAFEGIREAEHNERWFQAWKTGQTGYPLVDACMRSLIYNGWITFRMRAMLVSFASYHLWLDWRKTGYHLAQLFTDYEPGIHYSQLQMQSGVTGINTLRIYNPVKQSQEHDPNGLFIRRWIPGLESIPDDWIHEPWKIDEAAQTRVGCALGQDYPGRLVDHVKAVRNARSKIAAVRKLPSFKDDAQKVYRKLGSRKRPSIQQDNKRRDMLQLDLKFD